MTGAERQARYRARIGPLHAERQRQWRRANPDKQAEYTRRYRERHPDRVARTYWNLKACVMNAYGGQCACCGERQIEFLSIDHVDGSGADHREALGDRRQASGKKTYEWLRDNDFPQDGRFQVLCANCNAGKRRTGVCPHEQGRDMTLFKDGAEGLNSGGHYLRFGA